MKVKLEQIIDNPYRDRDKYPISRIKVDSLKESISDTDHWDNELGRPAGNVVEGIKPKDLVSYLQELEAAYNSDGDFLFTVELAYGHHRLEALKELGYEEIDIPVKPIDDKTMLKIMANENKGDWAGDMSVILETVRQARNWLREEVKPFITKNDDGTFTCDYKSYKEKTGSTVFTENAFKQIPAQGIGFRPTRNLLGETWAEQDVRFACTVLNDIDQGLYAQEQIIQFPSVSVLGTFSSLANAIHKQNWPEYFKVREVERACDLIKNPDVSTTVKILKSAKAAVEKGNNGVRVIEKPGVKQIKFDLVQELKDVVYENMDADSKLNLDTLADDERFKDFEGIDELVEEVRKSINRTEAARAGRAGGADEEGEAAEGDQADLEQTVADAEAEAGAVEDQQIAEGVDEAPDVNRLLETFMQSASVVLPQIKALIGRADEIGEDEAFVSMIEEMLAAIAILGGEHLLPDGVSDIVDEALTS